MKVGPYHRTKHLGIGVGIFICQDSYENPSFTLILIVNPTLTLTLTLTIASDLLGQLYNMP